MIKDKIFFDEVDPGTLNFSTPFICYGSFDGRLWSRSSTGVITYYSKMTDIEDTVTSNSINRSLSANQGRILDATKANKDGGNTFSGDQVFESGSITQTPLSSDPPDPSVGNSVQWISDGTGSGDIGDVMVKINVGGIVKTITLIDYSTS